MARRANAYQKIQAETASPAQRVVLVYKGISKNLRLAIAHIKDGAPEKIGPASSAIQFAQELTVELKLALDMERGGEIAQNLNNLYDFWIEEMSQGNMKKDIKKLEDIVPLVDELVEAWETIAKQVKL